MALSGSVKTTAYDGRYYQLTWTATQSIENNTSTVSWTLKAMTEGWWAERTLKVVIAGETVYNKTARVERWDGTVASGTKVIKHNDSGDASFAVSIQAAVYYSTVNCTGSATFTLNNIPRKSTLSANSGTLGIEQTLAVSRKTTSFTHTITYKCGSASGTICTKSSDLTPKWTPPLSLASQNTAGTSVSVTFTITTYSGNTNIGSNTETITCSIPSSVKPSCSIAVTDAMEYADTFGGYVQGQSKFKIVVTASGNYGSTIKNYKTTADGKTYTSASFTSSVISGSGTLTISATVTDSRGRTASASVDVTVLAYASPKISALSCYRSDADGKANTSGAYLAVKFSATITALNSKNAAAYFVEYRKTTDSDYTKITLTNYANQYSVSNGVCVFSADTGYSYNIILTAKDDFKSVPKTASGSSAKKLVSLLKKGGAIVGIAINKIAEIEDVFDINFKTLFRKNIYVPALSTIQVENPDGTYRNVFDPCNVNNDTLVGYGNYTAKDRLTKLCGHDVEFLVSSTATPQGFRPYRRAGDTLTFTVRVTGYVTNDRTEVHFTIPLSEPALGVSSATAASVNGFILRQNSLYTHGSSASVYAKPTSYQCWVNGSYTGISVIATFSNTTDAVNNSPVGIYWNGTITLS